MLSKNTRKRILERKWDKHSNTSQFLDRVKKECRADLDVLTLVAEQFEEKQVQEIFTEDKLESFIVALLRLRMDPNRKFLINHMILKRTLDNTEKLIENKLLKEQYKEHKVKLRKIINSIYQEKQTILGMGSNIDEKYFKEGKK